MVRRKKGFAEIISEPIQLDAELLEKISKSCPKLQDIIDLTKCDTEEKKYQRLVVIDLAFDILDYQLTQHKSLDGADQNSAIHFTALNLDKIFETYKKGSIVEFIETRFKEPEIAQELLPMINYIKDNVNQHSLGFSF